jgi:hypothetical protein
MSNNFVGFEVLSAVITKSSLWDIMPCSPVKVIWLRWRTYRLHLHGLKTKRSKKPAWLCLLHAGFVLGLLFISESRRSMFLRNVGWFSSECTALNYRRLISSSNNFNVYIIHRCRSAQTITKDTIRTLTPAACLIFNPLSQGYAIISHYKGQGMGTFEVIL